MVDVYIGPERKKFHLHEDLLCDRSAFFEKAFKGSFKEGTAKTMHLPDKHVALFELFVRWLYGATLCTPTTENVSHYVELYILGETFCIESLKNHSMDLIRLGYRIRNWRWGPDIISMIYDNTSANSPLRDFFFDAPYGKLHDTRHCIATFWIFFVREEISQLSLQSGFSHYKTVHWSIRRRKQIVSFTSTSTQEGVVEKLRPMNDEFVEQTCTYWFSRNANIANPWR